MLSFDDAQNIISNELEKIKIPHIPADLYNPVRYILSNGGKRIRSSLVLLACDMFGRNYSDAINVALGIEIFHSFTLVHDDLMDSSAVRRNKPTIHKKWNPNVAILSGDAMLILAYKMLTSVERHFLIPVTTLFNSTALSVCEGQMMDMNFENHNKVSVEDYLKMIGLKTSVLIAASLKLGALIAEANDEDCENIYSFGYNLGIAFQLQDDLLDVYGDSFVFGKKIGNDIVTNKKTYLMIKALELATGEQQKKLYELLSGTDFEPEEKIITISKIYNELNIKLLTENIINQYFDKASLNLENITVESERKKVFKDFALSLKVRDY